MQELSEALFGLREAMAALLIKLPANAVDLHRRAAAQMQARAEEARQAGLPPREAEAAAAGDSWSKAAGVAEGGVVAQLDEC